MELYQQSLVLFSNGKSQLAEALARQALSLESEAAFQLAEKYDAEPTRGLLFRSAATIALKLKEYTQAESLALKGLGGKGILKEIEVDLKEIVKSTQILKTNTSLTVTGDGSGLKQTTKIKDIKKPFSVLGPVRKIQHEEG
jgi:hypothetical protein